MGNHLRHAAHDMLFASVVAVMCGYDSYRLFSAFVEVNLGWLRARGCAFGNGVPPHDAFYWLFRQLDPSLLSACLRLVADALRKKARFEIVAIDGKGTRRGKDCGAKTLFGGEDYCRARREHAAENRASVRRIALNLLRRYGRRHKCGTKMAMMLANQLKGALDEMLAA